MIVIDQYIELQKEDVIFKTLDEKYKILCIKCIAVLAFYILLFVYLRIWIMVVFDVITMPIYFYILTRKFHQNITLYVSLMHSQIVIHSFFAVILLGWGFNFQILIFAMISTAYINRYQFTKNLKILTIFEAILFLILRIVTFFTEPILIIKPLIETFINESYIVSIISVINICIGFFALFSIACVNVYTNIISNKSMDESFKNLSRVAHIDPLTDVLNRRFIYDYIDKLEASPKVSKRFNNYVVALGDIDDFKDVNDTCGHEIGDGVLKSIADIMKHSVRENDLICRWGGEEFLIIMPDIQPEEAFKIIEKIRTYIEQKAHHYNKYRFIVTATFGMAISEDQTQFNEALAVADENLYKGKKSGKNITIFNL